MKHLRTHCSKIHIELIKKAENLAADNNESKTGLDVQIEVDDELYDFVVDLKVENYEYDEKTNFCLYNTSIFVTKIPVVKNQNIMEFLSSEILFETIYQD